MQYAGVEFENEEKTGYATKSDSGPNIYSQTNKGDAKYAGLPLAARNEPLMVKWLMAHRLVKSPAMARGLLVLLIIINLFIAVFVTVKYLL